MKQLRKPDVGNMKTVMAVVAVGLSVASFAESATFVVDKTEAGGAYVSIQSAVDAANDGDTILDVQSGCVPGIMLIVR